MLKLHIIQSFDLGRTIVFWVVWLLLFGPICFRSQAQESGEESEIKFPVELVDFHFSVTDEMEQPIVGAVVTIRGLRCIEDPGSWYGWPTGNAGAMLELATDAQGKVKLQYPIKFGSSIEWKTTSIICTSISHTDYVFEDIEIAVDGSAPNNNAPNNNAPNNEVPAHVQTLKSGCHVSFTAKDNTNIGIAEFGVLMAGAGRSAKWELKDSIVESRGVPDGSWQTMLVAVDEAGNPLFSGILPTRYAKGKDFTVKNVTLRPGLQVNGKLDSNVERPVQNGIVIAFSVPKPGAEGEGGWDTLVSWIDYCEIDADGSFHFASLPPTGDLQFISVCDGWLSKDIGWGDAKLWTVQGRSVKLADENIDTGILELVLDMEQTGTVEVTVLDEDNNPVVGIGAHSWPNQVYHRFGSTILGSAYRSLDVLKHQIAPDKYKTPIFVRSDRYSAVTNDQGVATIRGLPLLRNVSVMAANDDFASVDNVQFQCDSTKPVQATVRVKKFQR